MRTANLSIKIRQSQHLYCMIFASSWLRKGCLRMIEKNNAESGYFVIPEWKQSKDQILKDYFDLIESYSTCYNREKGYNQVSNTDLLNWLKHLRKLFLQIRRYEDKFKEMSLEDMNKKIQGDNLDNLAEFTNEVLSCDIVEEIRSIAKTENDPIVKYEKEAYKK
ncbi:MAG: hypothetical protein R6U11_01755 [Bacteroidales bacterium]